MDSLNITKIDCIGKGGQGATVWKVKIDGLDGYYADKVFELDNNPQLAEKSLKSSYAEFVIGKDLNHPNIAEHKYFMKKHTQKENGFGILYEYHIIMELVEGGSMSAYIKSPEFGPPPRHQLLSEARKVGS